MNAIYVMEICVLWKIKRRHESGFRDNVQANSSSQEGRESADQVQESSGDDIRNEVWILFELFLEPPVSC